MNDEQQEWPEGLASQMELTIAILQDPAHPLIQQPKLTERCLSRPPFRFLHDVISAVQRETGFAPGLYRGDELDSKTIQGKDAKVAYLFKIMSVVSMSLRSPIPADPFKVVAGLDPEDTNVFLQMLGKACTLGDAADIVQAVLLLDGSHQDEALKEVQHCYNHQWLPHQPMNVCEQPRTDSCRQPQQCGRVTSQGRMNEHVAGILSKMQAVFRRHEQELQLDEGCATSRSSEHVRRTSAPCNLSPESAPAEPESVDIGCMGFPRGFSQQIRKLTRSTSSSLAVFRRNGSLVHPAKV